MTPLIVTAILLLFTLPLAYMAGRAFASLRDIKQGHIRQAMPSLPSAPPLQGRPEVRWDKSVDRVEGKMLEMFAGGARGVSAESVAAQLGEDPMLTEAALSRLREEIPCRMRILRSGVMLHDFDPKDIAALKGARARSWPLQLGLTAMAVLANLGAAWPFISMGLISVGALLGIAAISSQEQAIILGISALIASAIILGATFVLGAVINLVLARRFGGPKLGLAVEKEEAPQRQIGGYDMNDVLLWNMIPFPSSGSSHRRDSSSNSTIDSNTKGSAIVLMFVVALLVAMVALTIAILVVWVRGLWRAMGRLGEPNQSTSPTLWVREQTKVDKWERYIPTNDLVVRTLHTLSRHLHHHRPQDDDLAARVLALARQKRGVITGLDLALHEGFDLDEAHQVGAKLTGMLGGNILVDNEGELAFGFPPDTLSKVKASTDEDMWAEYIEFGPGGVPKRRAAQRGDALPVNLVGLRKSHLEAMGRLVAGTYLMALMAVWAVSPGAPLTPFASVKLLESPWLTWAVVGLMVLIAFATATLVSAANHTASVSAEHGVRRDARRAGVKRMWEALGHGANQVDFAPLLGQLDHAFWDAWPKLPADLLAKELRAVAIDFELEPAVGHEGEVYELGALRRRLREDETFAKVFDFEETLLEFGQGDPNEVVFDTMKEVAETPALRPV